MLCSQKPLTCSYVRNLGCSSFSVVMCQPTAGMLHISHLMQLPVYNCMWLSGIICSNLVIHTWTDHNLFCDAYTDIHPSDSIALMHIKASQDASTELSWLFSHGLTIMYQLEISRATAMPCWFRNYAITACSRVCTLEISSCKPRICAFADAPASRDICLLRAGSVAHAAN